MGPTNDTFFINAKKNKNPENKDGFQKRRLENFNKNRVGLKEKDENQDKKDKKLFDKKTYRLKKYSKKYKLEQWEEQRKKKLLRNYHKELKKEAIEGTYKHKSFDDTDECDAEAGKFVKHPDLLNNEAHGTENQEKPKKTKNSFEKAKEHYDRLKQDKLNKKAEIEKAKEEKKKKLLEYKKKKQERYKKLSKKTKKGQPVMTGRLEMLLEKIQRS